MNAGLEIVAEEIAALKEYYTVRLDGHRAVVALMFLTNRLVKRMPEGVRGFDAEEFRARCNSKTTA